jgi:putative membrane protein
MSRNGRVFVYRGGGDMRNEFEPSTLIYRLIINATGLFLASRIVPGIDIDDWQALVAGTAIFAIVNVLLRPLAYLVSACLIILTLGFFALVVNTALLGATAWVAGQLDLNFTIDGFWSAFFGALVISLVSVAANVLVRTRRYDA